MTEGKEKVEERTPLKEFVNFMVFKMRSHKCDEFKDYCNNLGMNYAEAIIHLMESDKTRHSTEMLLEKVNQLEEKLAKPVKKKASRMGVSDE